MTVNLNQELKSAIPGDVFICTSGLLLTHAFTRGPDYHFPYLMKTTPVNPMESEVYVTYTLDGISCFPPGSTQDSNYDLSHKVVEIETTHIKLNKLYLRNDGKVIHTIKEHPSDYQDHNGVDRITDLTMEGSDGYFYSHKDGRAYALGTNYEMFLVAEVKCDPFTTLEDLDNAQEKLVFVKPW